MPQNNQVIPVQPKEARYPIAALYLTSRLTRATFQQLFGEQAPVFDEKRRIKRWFFTDVLEGSEDPANELCQFLVWDEVARKIKTITMSKLEASLPNLPGAMVYPKFVNPETSAAQLFGPQGDGGDGFSPLNGTYLSDPKLAKVVMDEINKALNFDYTMEYAADPWPWKYVWGTETRRNINFKSESKKVSNGASFIIAQRFEKGLGAPGKWVMNDTGMPYFVPDVHPTGEADTRPEQPLPVRALMANERIDCNPFACMVVRTDLTTNEPGPGTGALTVTQNALLKQIADDVAAVKGAVVK